MSQFIFLDESGDLGFSKTKKSSRFFVVSFIFVKDKRLLERIAKNIHKNLRKKIKRIGGGVLHAVKEKPETRIRLLRAVAKVDCSIMTIYLDKSRVYTQLRSEKHVLYNYVVNILLDRLMSKKLLNRNSLITLIAAKRETNKFLNENFSSYLQTQLKKNHKLIVATQIRSPQEEKSLQIADFICWALFRKYERGDVLYYDLIKSKIVEENAVFA